MAVSMYVNCNASLSVAYRPVDDVFKVFNASGRWIYLSGTRVGFLRQSKGFDFMHIDDLFDSSQCLSLLS